MPSSFTKWKQNAPTTKKATSVFQDGNGNPIPSGNLTFPTYVNYHRAPLLSPQIVSTAATNAMNFTPAVDGDLATFPLTANGQALAPLYTIIDDASSGFPCNLTFPGSTSDISINSTSGVVTLAAGVLTVPAQKEYCIKLRYKTPISASPGYSYSYLYGALKLRVLTPVTSIDYQHSPHILLTLSSLLDLGQFAKGSTITASPSNATAVITYFNPTQKEIYATVSNPFTATTSFRAGETISVSPGGVLNGIDAVVGGVYNIFTPATAISIPNVLTKPMATTASLAANGVTFSLRAPGASPFILLGSTTGSLSAAVLSHRTDVQYIIRAENSLGSTDINYNVIVANAYYPPDGNGELIYPQSATLSLHTNQLEGDLADYAVGATANTSYGGAATIVSYSADPIDPDGAYLTLTVTATGSYGFQDGMELIAGTSTMTITKVTDIFATSNSANIFSSTGATMLPYWEFGNADSNPYAYAISSTPTLPATVKFNTVTGAFTGYSKNSLATDITFQATNDFGAKAYFKRISFSSSTDVSPLSLTYGLTSTAGCTTKARLSLSNVGTPTLSGTFTVGGKIKSKNGATATITYIDNTKAFAYVDIDVGSISFQPVDEIDNKTTGAFATKGKIADLVYILEKNKPFNTGTCAGQLSRTLVPTVVNNIAYLVTPNLPSGFTFDTVTGTFTGTPDTLSSSADTSTTYTISVSNLAGGTTTSLKFIVSEPPKGLSYTHQVLLEVTGLTLTTDDIGSPITSDSLTSGGSGVIRDIEDSYVLVDVQNGYFEANSNIDNHAFYHDSAGTIKTIMNNSLAVKLDAIGTASPALTASGSIIYSGTGGASDTIAVVNYYDSVSGKAFLRLLQGSVSVSQLNAGGSPLGNFYCAATATTSFSSLPSCTSANSYYASAMNAPVVALAQSSGAPFVGHTAGDNLYVTPAVADTTSADVVSIKYLTGSDFITQSFGYIKPGVKLYRESSKSTARTAIGDVAPAIGVATPTEYNPITYTDTFIVYQGQDVLIAPELMTGQGVVYSLSPSFPVGSGLSFNNTTGVISGKVANSTNLTSYTITASNTMANISRTFKLQAVRHFEISAKMESAPSIFIHRQGIRNHVTPCRVTLDQVKGSNTNDINNEIICIAEAGELDLNNQGLKFSLFSGKNMCDQVSYTPYYFNAFPVAKTATMAYSVDCSCSISSSDATTAGYKYCGDIDATHAWSKGNYTYTSSFAKISAANKLCTKIKKLNGEELNCDEGKVDVTAKKFIDDPESGKCIGRPGTCTTQTTCLNAEVACSGSTATGTVGTWVYDCMADIADDTVESCGGYRFNCLGGAYEDAGFTAANLKLGVNTHYWPAITGLDGSTLDGVLTVKAPDGKASNMKIANFTSKNSCGSTLAGAEYTYFANGWQLYADQTSYTTSPWGQAQPFYTFQCLDSSGTTKASVRIMVREWDTMYDLTNKLDRLIDPTGTNSMDSTNDNYRGDWDDDWLSYPLYNNATKNDPSMSGCTNSASPTATRVYRFPGENY